MVVVPKRLAWTIIALNAVLALIVTVQISRSEWWRSRRYRPLIQSAAERYGVDPHLISAVIWQESRFRPREVGARGEIGLMQVTESAGREWASAVGMTNFRLRRLYDPVVNVEAGAWYLRRALQRWQHCSDPIPYALAEYNAGLSNAQRWYDKGGTNADVFRQSITYPTTRRYVDNIMKDYEHRRR
jgi:soluble lytic murein transglycosylase